MMRRPASGSTMGRALSMLRTLWAAPDARVKELNNEISVVYDDWMLLK